jgi:hypothetical protein
MNFVEGHPFAPQTLQEGFRICHGPPHARQFTVEVLDIRKGLRERGFSSTSDAPHPHNRAAAPLVFDAFQPIMTNNHTVVGWRMV